jgi:hypothetical protein
MSSGYLDELGRELTAAGVIGRTRARILTEFKDHLECDPKAQLGTTRELARQFADELGTSRVRRSAVAVFGALAVAGALFAVAFVVGQFRAPYGSVALAGAIVILISAQVAFASGVLAGLRTLRLRRARSVSRAEATVIVRRTAVALLAGIVTMGAMTLVGAKLHPIGSSFRHWGTAVEIAAAVGAFALIAASPLVLSAATLLPGGAGEAGDIFEDVGPLIPAGWRTRPWRFALVFAAAIGIAVALAGVVASDPYDGILRGIAEAVACLVGFAALGPYLGLWSRKSGAAAGAPLG